MLAGDSSGGTNAGGRPCGGASVRPADSDRRNAIDFGCSRHRVGAIRRRGRPQTRLKRRGSAGPARAGQRRKTVKRPSLVVAAAISAVALAAGLSACGGNDETTGGGGGGGAQKLDLTVGNLVPLTGDLAPYGPAGEKAGKLASQEINAAIKKAGVDQTVTLATEDGQSSDQGGVQAARKLIADGASCISGDYASTATVADARSVTINEGTMLISPASTADAVTDLDDNGLVSRTAPPDSLQGVGLADRGDKAIPGGLEGKTINIGARNDLYGTGFSESLQQELEGRGATVAENVVYDTEQPTYNSEAQQIVSGN